MDDSACSISGTWYDELASPLLLKMGDSGRSSSCRGYGLYESEAP